MVVLKSACGSALAGGGADGGDGSATGGEAVSGGGAASADASATWCTGFGAVTVWVEEGQNHQVRAAARQAPQIRLKMRPGVMAEAAVARRGGVGWLHPNDGPGGVKSVRTAVPDQSARKTMAAFWPPKPRLLLSTVRTTAERATFGT